MKKTFVFSVIMISPQLFCQTVKRQLMIFGQNCLPKSSVQRGFHPIPWCRFDDPWEATDHPEESPTTFKNQTRLSVDALRDDALCDKTAVFDSKIDFCKWKLGQSTAMPLSFAEKDWKGNCCSYTVDERYVFDIRSLCTANRRACECFSRIMLLSTSFTWKLVYNFVPRFFFNFDHNFCSLDGIRADQAPGWPGTLFGIEYLEAAW